MKFSRRTNGHRPLSNDEGKQLNSIVFYSPETQTILYKLEQGWIESGYRGDVILMYFPTCVNKRKEKLDSKTPFLLSTAGKHILYIPDTLFKFKDFGEIVRYEDEYTKSIYKKFEIELDCQKEEQTEIQSNKFEFYSYVRTDKKENGEKLEKLMSKFEKLNIDIKSYQLKDLLKHYDLIEK